MKKSISLAIVLALLLVFSAVAAAAEAPNGRPAPVDVERRSVNGSEYIVKTYELPPGAEAASLIEPEFEDGGYSFAHHTTTSEEQAAEERKSVIEAVSAESESKDLSEVLKRFASTLPYERDGFTGTLILDAGSIVTEAAGYKTVTSTIRDTREFSGMMYADPSTLPQSAVKNGITLPLSDVSWSVTGTSLAGDSLVPTEYKATAVYSKKVSSQVATGYISTANYTGEVSKREITGIVYTLTYKGTLISAPETDAGPFPWGVILKVLAVLLALGGGVIAVLYIRSRQGVQVFNLVEQDYLCIGRQRIDAKQPAIDLNEFGDVIQSNFFSFVLDKSDTRKLFGRNISVTLGDITIKHMIKEIRGPYRFNLEMGGLLDA